MGMQGVTNTFPVTRRNVSSHMKDKQIKVRDDDLKK